MYLLLNLQYDLLSISYILLIFMWFISNELYYNITTKYQLKITLILIYFIFNTCLLLINNIYKKYIYTASDICTQDFTIWEGRVILSSLFISDIQVRHLKKLVQLQLLNFHCRNNVLIIHFDRGFCQKILKYHILIEISRAVLFYNVNLMIWPFRFQSAYIEER